MNDLGPLFASHDDFDPEPPEPRTWSVLELNRAIEAALQQAFPGEVWLRGEIQGLARTRMRRHWYFDLVEKDPDSDRVLAKVSVALLQWNRAKVDRTMRDAPGFELDDDVEVRIRAEIGYYPPWGKLQLAMTGVDPSFTLGQMAANRERILRALAAEGLLEANAQLPMPLVPQRIGLVTSVGSAAYNDFVQEIARSGYGLRVTACDARVQGADTEATVIAALRTLVRHGCDVVVLARGGGSRSDLAGFDSEAIARAIAAMPVPVLTGIGHEIDTSVADAVAHTHFKTPTACAGALVERTRAAMERVDDAWDRVSRLARQRQHDEEARLHLTARTLARGAADAQRHRARDLADLRAALLRGARDAGKRASTRITFAIARAERLVHSRLAGHEARLDMARHRLAAHRSLRPLDRRAERLAAFARRVEPLLHRRLRRLDEELEARQRRLRTLDPRRLLARGYSLTYDAQGALLRDPGAVASGALLRTVVAGGEIDSRVEATRVEAPEPPAPETEDRP